MPCSDPCNNAPITDPAEKAHCLDSLLDRLAPGRSRQSKPPVSAQQLKATAVRRLDLRELSTKVRAGVVDDTALRPGIPLPENITQIRLAR